MIKLPLLSIIIFSNNNYDKLKKIIDNNYLDNGTLEIIVLNIIDDFNSLLDSRINDLERYDNIFIYNSCNDIISSMNLMLKIFRGQFLYLIDEDLDFEKFSFDSLFPMLRNVEKDSALFLNVYDKNREQESRSGLLNLYNVILSHSFIDNNEISFSHKNPILALRRFYWDISNLDAEFVKLEDIAIEFNNCGNYRFPQIVKSFLFLNPFIKKNSQPIDADLKSLVWMKANYQLMIQNLAKKKRKKLYKISFQFYRHYDKKTRKEEIDINYPKSSFIKRRIFLYFPIIRWSLL